MLSFAAEVGCGPSDHLAVVLDVDDGANHGAHTPSRSRYPFKGHRADAMMWAFGGRLERIAAGYQLAGSYNWDWLVWAIRRAIRDSRRAMRSARARPRKNGMSAAARLRIQHSLQSLGNRKVPRKNIQIRI